MPLEGKEVAFASDQHGDDFELYTANVFTGEVQRVTDNAMDDRNPAWPTYGEITYEAEYPRSKVRIGKPWAPGYLGGLCFGCRLLCRPAILTAEIDSDSGF